MYGELLPGPSVFARMSVAQRRDCKLSPTNPSDPEPMPTCYLPKGVSRRCSFEEEMNPSPEEAAMAQEAMNQSE